MSNYNKLPYIPVDGNVSKGWDSILEELAVRIVQAATERFVLVVECYQGVNHQELRNNFLRLNPDTFLDSSLAFLPENDIRCLTQADVTDDVLFGYRSRLTYDAFLDSRKVLEFRQKIKSSKGLVLVYGHAAALLAQDADCLIYADMARWEIQLRQRKHEVENLGLSNSDEAPGIQYKRGYFVDWRVCDRLKQNLFDKADYWLDTTVAEIPKMIQAQVLLRGLDALSKSPFRLVPYFDPGPWGGQWMKKVCGLDATQANFAWSFDGVPEENSLLLQVDGQLFEFPAINLVFYKSTELLGEPVESRFGKEFPIRFDFLDTMDGGNLSLQVHPTTEYIRETFGMPYTQDESYYMLDAKSDATVYLGIKTGCNPGEMLAELNRAQETGTAFEAEKYINRFSAKKHDHFLIPNGTIHCSGSNSMVLEISATPYIFTFKLYDWGRMGMDGQPRPINIKHGSNVIQWNRDTEYCLENLVDQVELVGEGEGWREERTGLHRNEFLETRRHWFTQIVTHHTGDSVNVLNLVEGEEVLVESPFHAFEPFLVHYAETFIVPATVGTYTIRPTGRSEGKECATIKAYVRFKD